MRLAFISWEYPPLYTGGIGNYTHQAAHMFRARGHDVTVFAGSAERTETTSDEGLTIERILCPERREFGARVTEHVMRTHAVAPFDAAEVPELYSEGSGLVRALPALPVLVRTHTPLYLAREIDRCTWPHRARLLMSLRLLAGVALGTTPWTQARESIGVNLTHRGGYRWQNDPECAVAHAADHVASPSRALRARLLADWRLAPENISAVPLPHAPHPALLALPPTGSVRTLLFYGGVRTFKGVHILVEAANEFLARHPDIRLIIAGPSNPSPVAVCTWAAWRAGTVCRYLDTETWLRPKLARWGDRVQWRGFVPTAGLPALLAEANACVFPSLFDNFPNTCLESMSAARAIIGSSSGGMSEMLADDAGLIVPAGNAAALAGAVTRLVHDPAGAAAMASRARARVLANYSPETVGPLHEAAFERAIQHHLQHGPRVFS